MKTSTIRNILVPIDFSKMSIQAIETAKRLAQRFGAAIHLAHVHQLDYLTGFTAPMLPLMPFSAVTFEQGAEKRLALQLHALANKHGLSSATRHVLCGIPVFDEICRLAQEIPADLIVTPTHGHTGFKHVFLGSTAERIVQHAPCPVLVVREKKRPPKTGPRLSINTILVPVDFSGCSMEGLKYAIAVADRVAAKLIVFHALQLGYAYTSDGYAMYDLSTLQDAARKAAERQMREFVRAAKFGRVKFETAIAMGTPVQEICARAQSNDVDLIITSTHGWTGFRHILIGSTAEHVVRHAPCAVLVVPSHPKIRMADLTRRSERGYETKGPIASTGARKKKSIEPERLTRKFRKLTAHPFPERRKTNKFRETHLHNGG